MISLVYALAADEEVDAASLQADGFIAIERGGRGYALDALEKSLYVIVPPRQPGSSTVAVGHALRDQADAEPGHDVLLANGGAFASPRELWQVLEAAHHPRVKIAWSAATGRATNRTAAMAVPTLNLRIGLVRLDAVNEESLAYARRLAGIGFAGRIVIDPLIDVTGTNQDRRTIARELAAAIKATLAPRKPVKAMAKPK